MASFINRTTEDINMDKEREERDKAFANNIKKRMLDIVKKQIVACKDEKTSIDLVDLYAYIAKIKPDMDELFIYDKGLEVH